jgi:phosphatidylglycerophosphate synthase
MTTYQPTSRRPIADVFRRTARAVVDFCVRRGISADAVSYASIGASLIAGILFAMSSGAPWLLLIAPAFCYARLWLNMLDGMVAIAARSASKRGEIVNELPDRASDIFIFAGVAHSTFCLMPLAYWAALLAVMTAYVGVTGQAVAGVREYGGLMSKPWRMVTLHVGAWATWAMLHFGGRTTVAGSLTAIDVACIVILVGCLQTCYVRLRATVRRLDAS